MTRLVLLALPFFALTADAKPANGNSNNQQQPPEAEPDCEGNTTLKSQRDKKMKSQAKKQTFYSLTELIEFCYDFRADHCRDNNDNVCWETTYPASDGQCDAWSTNNVNEVECTEWAFNNSDLVSEKK